MLDHVFATAIAPQSVFVDAFTRTANITEHDFLRGPLEALRGDALAGMQQALVEAAAAP
jgi:hypothetical protein